LDAALAEVRAVDAKQRADIRAGIHAAADSLAAVAGTLVAAVDDLATSIEHDGLLAASAAARKDFGSIVHAFRQLAEKV
jgi:hypothetical protein